MTMLEEMKAEAALQEDLLQEDAIMDDELAEGDSADELFEHFAITVDKGQKMLRLDKYLVDRMEHCSRNRILFEQTYRGKTFF